MRRIVSAAFAVSLFGLLGAPEKADAGVLFSVSVAPPPLPVYAQPPIPGPGYIWTPGYWAWDDVISDYYWVPAAWVLAPRPGLLWTPGYWGWREGVYVWNTGYWGPRVGFYGGVPYGYGYTGVGFAGGYWSGGRFFYNRSVTNISNTVVITNVYEKKVINANVTNVSFNGGEGGIHAQPSPADLQAARDHHIEATGDQLKHQELAQHDPKLRAGENHGVPPIAAVAHPGDLQHGAIPAHAALGAAAVGAAAGAAALHGRVTGNPNNGEHVLSGTHGTNASQGNAHGKSNGTTPLGGKSSADVTPKVTTAHPKLQTNFARPKGVQARGGSLHNANPGGRPKVTARPPHPNARPAVHGNRPKKQPN